MRLRFRKGAAGFLIGHLRGRLAARLRRPRKPPVWAPFASLPTPRAASGVLAFSGPRGCAEVSAVAEGIVRIRLSPTPELPRHPSWAVVPSPPPAGVTVEVEAETSVLATRLLRVAVRHGSFAFTVATADGEVLDEPQARGIETAGRAVRLTRRLRDGDRVYGLGQKTGPLDRRGRRYEMWNRDPWTYGTDTDPLYSTVPFYLVLRQGRAYGVFLDNPGRTRFDLTGGVTVTAEENGLDLYFLAGPSPAEVVRRYAELTGRLPLPPRWALGYHQCRYSYYPADRLRRLAWQFRHRRLPADALWLDIHHLDGFNPLTWDAERFPDPAGLIRELREQGLRVVTIVDPHPKVERGSPVYESGRRDGHFVRRPRGRRAFVAPCWPSRGERAPGPSVYPDFARPAARDWWGGLHAPLLDAGVAGIWNDMNEPSVFIPPDGTMPPDLRHDREGTPARHGEIHNAYGQLMSRATWEGLTRLRPRERPFVLTRSTYAGGQRYAAVWTGDCASTWEHLRGEIPMLLSLGLSGFAFAGSDVGGFSGVPTAELYTRWLQASLFVPFLRTHTADGTPEQEPWSFGPVHEAVHRRAIELRYEFLPHLYNLFEETSRTGLPVLRPLLLEYPEDSETWSLADSFLVGADLLVAPVLEPEATARTLYLPAGEWYGLWTGERLEGGRRITVPVTLDSIPVFARAGAFVFRQPVVQHTGEMAGQPLLVTVWPAAASESWFYEDDGETPDYRHGAFHRRRFAQRREGGEILLEAGAAEGAWRPAARQLVWLLPSCQEPSGIRLEPEGRDLPRTVPGDPREGWSWDQDGELRVRIADRPEALAVRIALS